MLLHRPAERPDPHCVDIAGYATITHTDRHSGDPRMSPIGRPMMTSWTPSRHAVRFDRVRACTYRSKIPARSRTASCCDMCAAAHASQTELTSSRNAGAAAPASDCMVARARHFHRRNRSMSYCQSQVRSALASTAANIYSKNQLYRKRALIACAPDAQSGDNRM